jgi:type IV secretion system protein TrbL
MSSWSPEFFQQIMGPFVNNPGWAGAIYTYAIAFYFMCATLTLAWIAASGVLARDLHGMIAALGHALVAIGVGWVVLNNANVIGNDIYNTFVQIAGTVGGLPASAISPDGLMVFGVSIANTMFSSVGLGTWLIHVETAILISIIAILVFLLYLAMAAKLAWLIIQAYFAIVIGPLLLGFGAFGWLASLASTWLMWLLGVSIEIFIMFLVLSIGLNMEEGWAAQMAASGLFVMPDIWVALIALGQAIVLACLAIGLPGAVRRLVTGTSGAASSLGSLVGGAITAARVAAGADASKGSDAAASAGGGTGSASSQAAFQTMMMKP